MSDDQIRDKRDELADVLDTIKSAIWNIDNKELEQDIRNTILPYEEELEELDEKVEEMDRREYDAEMRQREYEYNKMRL